MNRRHSHDPAPEPARAGLEEAIAAADVPRVTRILPGTELFVRFAPEDHGTMLTSAAGGLTSLVQAYTSRVRPGMVYGGMTWETVVGIVARVPSLQGIHIINDDDYWVIITRADLGISPDTWSSGG